MSQEVNSAELQQQTRQLLDGPLKHIRVAALAAALLPLASVAAAPASAQDCAAMSAGVCGTVFNDANHNGVRDASETGMEGVKVSLLDSATGEVVATVDTGPDGSYSFFWDSIVFTSYTVSVTIPTGTQVSPTDAPDATESTDSDGAPDGSGHSIVENVFPSGSVNDFGFYKPTVSGRGTGTPGSWKNHPDAGPVSAITVGGVTYTKAQAITWLGRVGKDKTTTMFSSLVPAMLNLMVGNDGSCVSGAIAAGNAWMATYGPVGSNVPASSYAWSVGEATHVTLDDYNNGRLCAPHRQ